jgi:hypothetical protein
LLSKILFTKRKKNYDWSVSLHFYNSWQNESDIGHRLFQHCFSFPFGVNIYNKYIGMCVTIMIIIIFNFPLASGICGLSSMNKCVIFDIWIDKVRDNYISNLPESHLLYRKVKKGLSTCLYKDISFMLFQLRNWMVK